MFPPVASVFIGARPFTQVLDIMHGLQAVIEKGLDSHGEAAVAQMDIKRYYDSIPTLRIFIFLAKASNNPAAAACLLRLHMCPIVALCFSNVCVNVTGRSIGVLTGTRTAGLVGRVPVEDIIHKRHHIWEEWCFRTDSSALALATYVDNIFSTGRSADDAVAILKDCELQLAHHWALVIGSDSKSFMAALGAQPPDDQTVEWAHHSGDTFEALGHILASNGSIQPCLSSTIGKMWRAFYGNFRRSIKQASTTEKLKLLNRAVLPVASCRMSRWPYQKQAAKRLNSTQNRMVGIALNLKMQHGEDVASFVRRRNRISAQHSKAMGTWSGVWRKRVTDWNDHLNRDRNASSWAAKTLHYHGKHWLQEQRILHAIGEWGSMLAGRTCTRAFPGIVHKRWHDGVDLAKAM